MTIPARPRSRNEPPRLPAALLRAVCLAAELTSPYRLLMCRILCTNEMIAGVQSRPMTIAMMTESMIQASSRRHRAACAAAGDFRAVKSGLRAALADGLHEKIHLRRRKPAIVAVTFMRAIH